jgi:Family of unknown function (DUF6228)
MRVPTSIDKRAAFSAAHDGLGHVCPRFVVRGPRGHEPDAWEASVRVNLDAGEGMRRFAAEIAALLGWPRRVGWKERNGHVLMRR